ncbi:MAG: T9SS type A sorting domain-containing protein [Ferruginibacter sp.]
MKKNLLLFAGLFLAMSGFAQNCITVTSATFTNPSGDNQTWNLNLAYTASGNKALEITVYCGNTAIFNTCLTTNGSGSTTYTGLSCNNGFSSLTAVFVPHTGNCGSAACGPTQTLPPDGGPLPVKLTSFYAKRSSAAVLLSWQTAMEENSKEYIIQKKTAAGFIDIATIPSKNAANGSSYSYTDINTDKGFSEYRLKIVDIDQKTAYSEVRTVKGTESAVTDFTIFPNPSNGYAKITVSDISEPVDVQLIDMAGRVLQTYSMNNKNSFELNGLRSGLYLVKVINKTSGASTVKKLNVIN